MAWLLASLVLAAAAAPAQATVTSTFSGPPDRILTVSSDGADDTIEITCASGLKVNGAPPPSGALACTEVFTLVLNGGGGNDKLDVSSLSDDDFNLETTTLDGGDGDDDVRGVSFASNGYTETTLGGPGNDVVTPNGGEVARGGAGDDRIVGLAQDTDGEAGTDTFAIDLGATAGAYLMLKPTDAGLTIAAPGSPGQTSPWESIEALDLKLSDGASDVDASAFTGTARIQGLGGPDTLIGTSNADVLDGGAGNDYLDGGAGPDVFAGGDGVDYLRARDGAADSGDCGDDDDTLIADAAGDNLAGCERVDLGLPSPSPTPSPTPAADTTAPVVTVGRATVRRGRLRLQVGCPATEVRCVGTLTFASLGSVAVNVAGGASVTIRVKVSARQRRRLKRGPRRLRVKLDILDPAGNRLRATKRVKLRLR